MTPRTLKKRRVVFYSPYRKYHEKLFERLGKRFLSGRQTVITPNVLRFAESFKGNDLLTAQRIVARFADPRIFRRVRLSFNGLKRFYAKRTADDIIYSKTIVAMNPKLRKEKEPMVHGCADHAVAIAAVFRAKGIQADVVRQLDHSFVLFKLEGKWFIADPTDPLPEKRVREFIGADTKLAKMLEERGAFVRGLDLWDLGIKSINDFQKYMH